MWGTEKAGYRCINRKRWLGDRTLFSAKYPAKGRPLIGFLHPVLYKAAVRADMADDGDFSQECDRGCINVVA